MRSPKVVVIGAGSHFFGRSAIWKMTQSEQLREGTLALVDTNPRTLETMVGLAERMVEAAGVSVQVLGTQDYREVLPSADFVVLTFSRGNTHYRGVDCEVASKYGITMCSGDTIGPGGIFRALREIPVALDIARETARVAPHAWVVNLVNPTAVIGLALMRHAPEVRSFALCDGLHEPYFRLSLLRGVGILPEKATRVPPEVEAQLDLAVGGVNHFTWIMRFRYAGEDMLPRWREVVARRAKEQLATTTGMHQYDQSYVLDLLDVFGACPDIIEHIKEYVPFYQGHGVSPITPAPILRFDAEQRARAMDEHLAECRAYARREKPIAECLANGRSDHAMDIIESMWGQLSRPFYINTANRGGISNLPEDSFLELRCDVDMTGPRPQPVGDMPRGILGRTQQVLDIHELTVEAAMAYDRRLVLRALATDPLICNLGDARQIMEELFTREEEALDSRWY